MASVKVSGDCSPFWVGLPISLEGIQGMMCRCTIRSVVLLLHQFPSPHFHMLDFVMY